MYPIYKVKYSTHSQSPCYAVVSADSSRKVEGLLEKEVGEESFEKVWEAKDTGYKADKEGVIFNY